MSGKNQHFIPRSFLRGFKAAGESRNGNVWVFRRAGEPQQQSISEVAAGHYFYSEPSADGTASLDDRITKYENRFARQLDRLRRHPVGAVADPTDPAKVVSHLIVRNQQVRGAFSDGMKGILVRLFGLLGEEEGVRGLLGLDATVPTQRFREAIQEAIRQSPFSRQAVLPPPVLERVLIVLARERFTEFFAQQQPLIRGSLAHFYGEAETFVQRHIIMRC